MANQAPTPTTPKYLEGHPRQYRFGHRPGPWVAEGWENVIVNDSKGNTLALSPGGGEDVPLSEVKANASLIAAAPDLLESLILSIKESQSAYHSMSLVNKEMGFDEPKLPAWLVKAEAAIEKALAQ
ncbi:MAG: hypothetical protein JWP57_2037 [Spirosoma sp.]|nr:hypothetical protein [Spirosoma sp.]